MKKFFRIVFLALVLLVVAMVSALATMRFAINGGEVAVPNLVDHSPSEARRIAEDGGFGLTIERQFYSDMVPAGRILSQVPSSGTSVRRGWEIRAAESLGPQRVQIPNVMGQSERAAELNIKQRGLDVSSVAEMPWPADVTGQVLAQNPSPNASGISTPKISLLVNTQPPPRAFLMPSFIGKTVGEATSALREAGLREGTVTFSPDANPPSTKAASSPASIIVSQKPSSGEKVSPGAAVNFEVRQ